MLTTKKYRKKPVEVRATLLRIGSETNNVDDVAIWCGGKPHIAPNKDNPQKKSGLIGVDIPTLEGTMLATAGDYVIQGTDGEFYPCKAHIFHKIYEEVK